MLTIVVAREDPFQAVVSLSHRYSVRYTCSCHKMYYLLYFELLHAVLAASYGCTLNFLYDLNGFSDLFVRMQGE